MVLVSTYETALSRAIVDIIVVVVVVVATVTFDTALPMVVLLLPTNTARQLEPAIEAQAREQKETTSHVVENIANKITVVAKPRIMCSANT